MSEKTGRSLFKKNRKAIMFASWAVRQFPEVLQSFFWDVSNIFDGKISAMVRYAVLRSISASVGDNVYIAKNVTIKNPGMLRIGSNVSIHTGCYIDAIGGCSIGNDVSIAHASSIITFDHTWDDKASPIKYNPISKNPVLIEDDVWVGCGVRILSGVSIGKRSVVAAGAVVTKNLAPGALYVGVPAKKLKTI